MRDWNDAFNNMGHVKGSDALPGFWAARAAEYRAGTAQIETDIKYGTAEREVFDLVLPDGDAKGLIVFVHGGFWMRLDKSYWSDLAEGARLRGWAVCIPSYTLTPDISISGITRQIGSAIQVVASRIAGPIRLAGHSAGGHLVTRMLCADSPLPSQVHARTEHCLSISGLHDLRPLLHTGMNATLRMTAEEAVAESPVLQAPALPAHLTCWVGGGERPEFIRQSRILTMMWDGLDAQTRLHVDADYNHFTVLEGLKDQYSPICEALLGDM